MRVAYLVSEYPSPSHTFIRREIGGLRKHGLFIKIFSVRRPDDSSIYSNVDEQDRRETTYLIPVHWPRLLAAHIRALAAQPLRYFEVLRFATHHRVSGIKSLIWSLFHFAEAIQLAAELRSADIQHLHNHFANSGATVGLLAAKFAALPWSMTLHGISETDYPAGVLLSEKIEAAKFVACASYFIRAQALRGVSPEHWDKLTIVRCAVDQAALPRRRERDPLAPLTVVAVGRLSPEKGFHGLLTAFAHVRSRGINAKLTIVGAGQGRTALEQHVGHLQIAEHVTFKGGLAEADTLAQIAEANVLALSSLMEGLPVVLIEALALGVPVVASHIAGIPELIEDERTGMLFRPTDWNELGNKLERLLTDPELRRRLAAEGKKKIETGYLIDHASLAMLQNLGYVQTAFALAPTPKRS